MRVGNVQLLGERKGGDLGGGRDGDDQVNGLDDLGAELLQDGVGEGDSHVLAGTVDRDTVDDGVGTGEVDVLEDIGGEVQGGDNLAEERLVSLSDDDGLTGGNGDVVAELELVKSNALRSKHVVHSSLSAV